MSKFRAVVAGVSATALIAVAATPAEAATSSPLLTVKAQVLQDNCGSGILGTTGTVVLGAPLTICI
jgi:hypothetical protein